MERGHLVAITVVGNDRPGIVAGVTRVLYDAGCNLEDATSSILRGHFSMMLIVRPPSGTSAEDLEAQLAPVAHELSVAAMARQVEEVPGGPPMPTHMVSVYGADEPGIVFRVARQLAETGVNITALSSRVIGDDDQPVYALMLEVAATDDVENQVEVLRAELDMDVTIHRLDAAVL